MNSYPGLVRIKDRVVYDVGRYQRYGFVEALRHHDGRTEPCAAAVQPSRGAPGLWIELDLLTPLGAS